MKLRLSQASLFTSIISAIDSQAKELGIEHFGATVRQLNSMVKAANDIVAAMDKDDIPSTMGMGLRAWLQCDDIGLSSRCMAYVLANGPRAEANHPHDADDFARCHRFLIAVPEATSGTN